MPEKAEPTQLDKFKAAAREFGTDDDPERLRGDGDQACEGTASQSRGHAEAGRLTGLVRVETSFQDTPGDGYYFVLLYEGRPLAEQLDALGLGDGSTVRLWEPDCGDFELDATLLVNFAHPWVPERMLWARDISASSQTL